MLEQNCQVSATPSGLRELRKKNAGLNPALFCHTRNFSTVR